MSATVVVIGAGQAGLSAAYHLKASGFAPALPSSRSTSPLSSHSPSHRASEPLSPDPAQPTFVVLDANPQPGGAWQHRWDSLRMETVNGIFDLPGMTVPPVSPTESSNTAVPRYFADYEESFDLPILRPVTATSVARLDQDPTGLLEVTTNHGTWRARAVINATGTWNNPLLPEYPGSREFRGQQLHARDYTSAQNFTGLRVGVVGGGITAVQLLEEISRVATTRWYTRRDPVFIDGPFTPETTGVDVVARVTADAEAGLPARSVVSYTNLFWTPYARAAQARGALDRRPMFQRITPRGVIESDGSVTTLDVILWATGFRADLAHLDPLRLQNSLGGITVTGTAVSNDPRIHLIGFGPSQSTVGANRAGRAAVRDITRFLRSSPPSSSPVQPATGLNHTDP
ncbi:MAG: NAD(P)-binding domain-containing protein [Mycetocola sp.]